MFHRRHFSTRLFLIVSSLLIILVMIFAIMLYSNTKKQTLHTATDTLVKNTKQLSYQTDYLFQQINTLSLQMVSSPSLREYFQNNRTHDFNNPDFQGIINKLTAQIVLSTDYPTRITFFDQEGHYASSGIPSDSQLIRNFFSQNDYPAWYQQKNQFSSYILVESPTPDIWSHQNTTYISYIRRIINSITFDQIGLVEIQFSPDIILSQIESSTPEVVKTFILGTDGQVFVTNTLAEQAKQYYDACMSSNSSLFRHLNQKTREQEWISFDYLSHANLLVIQVHSETEILSVVRTYGKYMSMVCVLLILAFVSLTFLLINMLTRPLRNLQSAIMEIAPITETALKQDEFQILEASFSSLTDRLSVAISEAVEARTQKERLQFAALQAQTNPHFIFNVISVINALAAEASNMDIYDISSSFSDMLRYILNTEEDTVPLHTELQHCDNYLKIMKARYEAQLECTVTIDNELLGLPVPRLSLQPLLENCFKHGFRETSPPYAIQLTIKKQDGLICFNVSDNGIGVIPRKLFQLREQLIQKNGVISRTPEGGLGLRSSYYRFLHLYPSTEIHIDSIPKQGFTVQMTVKDEKGGHNYDSSYDCGR